MHQCVKYEVKFSTWCKKSRQLRREQACCSVCRVVFCCTKDRENHEEAEHGKEATRAARQQRQILKGNKPLVCLSCCQVFVSGLFVNDTCNNVSDSAANFKATKSAHVLLSIPEWAVEKYLVPRQSKRSWDKANEDAAVIEILVHPATDKTTEDCISVQENSFTQKTSIHSILTKQRKTDLAGKRERRVTFSPVAAVALTSRLSIVKMGSQKTRGDSSPDSTPNLSSPQIRPKTPEHAENSIRDLRSENSAAPIEKESAIISAFSPSLSNNDTSNEICAESPSVPNVGDSVDCVFSPPLPDGGTNGSPMMTPQMSSTPVNENSELKTSSTLDCLSEQETSREGTAPSEGIFSSLANVICCAFQSLPSVLTQFFSSINQTEQNDNKQDSSSTGRHRRQRRRRSTTFTPYLPASNKWRRLNPKKKQPLSPPSIVKILRSPRQPNWD